MKFWQSTHTFEHPWSTVTQAFWRKYPNEFNSVVQGTDVIERHVAADGKLHSTRIIISEWNIPGFMSFFMPSPRAYAMEYSVVDPVSETLTIKSYNINASSILSFVEGIVYKSNGENSTDLLHEARIRCTASIGPNSAAEKWIAGTLGTKAKLGLQAMDSIINKVEAEALGAIRAVDDFTSETIKSVDSFTTDAIKSMDNMTTEALKSMDDIRSDAVKSMDGLTNDAIKSIDSLTLEVDNFSNRPA